MQGGKVGDVGVQDLGSFEHLEVIAGDVRIKRYTVKTKYRMNNHRNETWLERKREKKK